MRSKEISFHAGAPASSAPTATDRNSKLGVRQGGRPSYTQWLQMSPPVRSTNQTSVTSDNSCLWRTKQSTEPRPDPTFPNLTTTAWGPPPHLPASPHLTVRCHSSSPPHCTPGSLAPGPGQTLTDARR